MDGLERRLRGEVSDWPNGGLTLALLAAAVVLVVIALFGPPVLKAAALVWVALP